MNAVVAPKNKKRQQRPCGDGSLSLADLNIDVLERIANQLDTEHFIALCLALPKGLWTAKALVERRLPDIMRFNRAAELFRFLGTIQPHYLNRLSRKTYLRLCSNPIHVEDRIGLIQTLLTDHKQLFSTPGFIRQAKANFKQFDPVRRSAYLSKALRNTWLHTYKTCNPGINFAKSLVRSAYTNCPRPGLFGPNRTFVEAMTHALINHKHQEKLIPLIINLSSMQIHTFRLNMPTKYKAAKDKDYEEIRYNLINYLKYRHGEFGLFIKLVLNSKSNLKLQCTIAHIDCSYMFRPYRIIILFTHWPDYIASIEEINRKWCEYLAVEHVPRNYRVDRIHTLWQLTREKFATQ